MVCVTSDCAIREFDAALFSSHFTLLATWLLQNLEFDVYENYANDVTKENGRMRLHALLQNSDAIITLEVVL